MAKFEVRRVLGFDATLVTRKHGRLRDKNPQHPIVGTRVVLKDAIDLMWDRYGATNNHHAITYHDGEFHITIGDTRDSHIMGHTLRWLNKFHHDKWMTMRFVE